jgi:hypothetical protein
VLTCVLLGGCSSKDSANQETVPGGEIAKKLDKAAEQSRPGARKCYRKLQTKPRPMSAFPLPISLAFLPKTPWKTQQMSQRFLAALIAS